MSARNGALTAFAALALLAPGYILAQAATLEWEFRVLLDGKKIGYHDFTVRQDGQQRVLETEADFDVKFLFFTAFSYEHESREVWEDGCLESIDADTNNNGDELSVEGSADDGQFTVRSKQGEQTLSGCVRSFAYWNPQAVLEADRLLNSQTGNYEDVQVEFEGSEPIQVGDRSVDSRRYRLSAKAGDIRLWYSADDEVWLALEAPAKGGRTIRYEPVDVPRRGPIQQLARND